MRGRIPALRLPRNSAASAACVRPKQRRRDCGREQFLELWSRDERNGRMRRIFPAALCGIFIAATGLKAQTFDVASVRINKAGRAGGEGQTTESIMSEPGALIMKNVTLRSCVRWAYGVRDFQISGGPGWLSTERYDVSARAAAGAGDAELRKMLRALLVERFQLGVREESKRLPVYALVVSDRKPGLKPASGSDAATMLPGDGALVFRNTSMDQLAGRLASRPLSVDRPVLDKTALSGEYDFSLRFADNAAGLKSALEDVDRGNGQSIFSALRQQLGLKLEPRKASLPVVVIEHAVEVPGEN
jgi:uncharacterized protein (TIGR03435 family)